MMLSVAISLPAPYIKFFVQENQPTPLSLPYYVIAKHSGLHTTKNKDDVQVALFGTSDIVDLMHQTNGPVRCLFEIRNSNPCISCTSNTRKRMITWHLVNIHGELWFSYNLQCDSSL